MARSKDFAASSKSLTLIAIILLVAALYFGRAVLIPFALGVIFSFLLTPFVVQLEKLRIGRGPSVVVVLILAFGFLGTVTWGVTTQLMAVMVNVTDYKSNLDNKIKSFHTSNSGSLSKATATVEELNKELAAVPGQISSAQERAHAAHAAHPIAVEVAAPPTSFIQDLRALLGPLAGVMEMAAIVTIFTIFMLLKREDLRNRVIRLAGRGQLTVMTQALDDAGRRLSRYLLMQFLVNAGYGLAFGAGLYFIGIPHAFLWGAIAALFRFIPYIGVLGAAACPILMALAVFPGWRHAGMVFGLFVFLELIVSNVVEPFLYGVNTGMSSLAILVAAVFWTTLWGPVGLILSTPLTVCLVVLGRYVPQLSFLEVVLGDEPVLAPEQHFYQRLLAMDQEEARSVAQQYLGENSTEALYDSIFIPVLKLAEQDYRADGIDEEKRKFMLESIAEFIDEIGERDAEERLNHEEGNNSLLPLANEESGAVGARIVCIPATPGADGLAANMISQLFRKAGYSSRAVSSAPLEHVVADLSQRNCDLILISALPAAVGQARSLCKRLQSSFAGSRVIVGLWQLDGGIGVAKERLGAGCSSVVAITLADAVEQVRILTEVKNSNVAGRSEDLAQTNTA